MKNKLSDLNDHLFAQLERLSDEKLKPEQLERESKRGEAVVAVADSIIRNAALQLAAARLVHDHGKGDPMLYLPNIEGRARAPQIEAGKPEGRKQ
jgi:hypothetical protein